MTTKEPNMIRTNYYMPAELLARLKEAKARTGMSVAEFMRRAVERALRELNL